MALLNRFSKLNDRGETGIFTFIVTKSVTRDFHRDATTKDFCFGYHRWAISFQRPTEKVLGVHLLLRNPSPNTACVVDFSLTLLNRQHFSQNEVYTKRQAKFTITNPMQGVSRWIQMSDLIDRHFSNETGEFLFELSLSNMISIFECDVQLSPSMLTQYKTMLKSEHQQQAQQCQQLDSGAHLGAKDSRSPAAGSSRQPGARSGSELISLETNYFTFGAFDWSLTIVPLVTPSSSSSAQAQPSHQQENSSTSSSSSNNNLLTPNKHHSTAKIVQKQQQQQRLEPVCRVYLNRLNGFDCLCRVKYRVILGHHQPGGQQSAEFVDSRVLDQISDSGGRIRGHQFKNANILKLISLRSAQSSNNSGQQQHHQHHQSHNAINSAKQHNHSAGAGATLDLRVHIEMFCANTISEALVSLQPKQAGEPQLSNCSDRNKQAWCVESDSEGENVRLKLFFLDLKSVPRNHIRYISWCAYLVRRDPKSGALKESLAVRNSPHCNYYLQDGIDMGTIMETDCGVEEIKSSNYLEANKLTVHIEWIDSLLLFSHLYNNYDALATIQRHQISRELDAIQLEFEHLERKYIQSRRTLSQLLGGSASAAERQLSGSNQGAEDAEYSTEEASLAGSPLAAPARRASAAVVASKQATAAPAPAQLAALAASNSQATAKALPMSLEERIKFSSSTPPALLAGQQHQEGVRRRLPQQPAPFQADQQPRTRLNSRRDSQPAYRQQIRVEQRQAAFGIDGPINEHRLAANAEQQQVFSSEPTMHAVEGRRVMNMLMEPLINQVEGAQVVDRYHHAAMINPSTLAPRHPNTLPNYRHQESRCSTELNYGAPAALAAMQTGEIMQETFSPSLDLEMETLYLSQASSSAQQNQQASNSAFYEQTNQRAPSRNSSDLFRPELMIARASLSEIITASPSRAVPGETQIYRQPYEHYDRLL